MARVKIKKMSKTLAGKIARLAREHGHYRHKNIASVDCPLCKKRVKAEITWRNTVTQSLDKAVVGHLEDEHETVERAKLDRLRW